MTETTHLAPPRPDVAARRTAGRITWRGILRSEWLRLATTRSTWVTMLATGVLMALIGVIAAAASTGAVDQPGGAGGGPGGGPPGLTGADAFTTLTAGSTMVVLVIGVLGVMLGAREYASGFVRVTYAAVPRRWRVLTARVLVLAASAGVALSAGLAVAFAGGNAVLSANDAATVAWDDDGVLRALAGTVAYLVGAGVLGLCAGTLTRSIGLGVGSVIALLVVIPGFGSLLLPEDWQDALDYLPSIAATSFTSVDAGADYLSLGAGAVVFGLWVLVGLAGSAAVLARRDV